MENRLATLLREHRAEILAAWEAAVRTLPTAANHPGASLTERHPRFLDLLADRLAAEAPGAEGDDLAREHARARIAEGFDVVEIVAELSLLRECVLDAWEAAPEGILPAEIRRMDAEVDHALTLCAVEYVRRAPPELAVAASAP